jgi:hypothetical protein
MLSYTTNSRDIDSLNISGAGHYLGLPILVNSIQTIGLGLIGLNQLTFQTYRPLTNREYTKLQVNTSYCIVGSL